MHQYDLYPYCASSYGSLSLGKHSFECWSICALKHQALKEQRKPNAHVLSLNQKLCKRAEVKEYPRDN